MVGEKALARRALAKEAMVGEKATARRALARRCSARVRAAGAARVRQEDSLALMLSRKAAAAVAPKRSEVVVEAVGPSLLVQVLIAGEETLKASKKLSAKPSKQQKFREKTSRRFSTR